MVRINVSSSEMLQLALSTVIKQIETHDGFDNLLLQGCDPSFIDMIRHRPMRDLMEISTHLRKLVIVIDSEEVRHSLKRLDSRRENDLVLEYFIKHGAGRTMIQQLFKVSSNDVRRLQAQLIGKCAAGRVGMPRSNAERDAIHQSWKTVSNATGSLREQLYRLHHIHPDYSIESLWLCVNEFNEDFDPNELPPQSRFGETTF